MFTLSTAYSSALNTLHTAELSRANVPFLHAWYTKLMQNRFGKAILGRDDRQGCIRMAYKLATLDQTASGLLLRTCRLELASHDASKVGEASQLKEPQAFGIDTTKPSRVPLVTRRVRVTSP